jgi:GrpB-like predicted nucleotidyltransferase (UPF0157 family)
LEAPSPVVLEPYSQSWPARFESIKERLADIFPRDDFDFEHIGSTAVPGLIAKPVIDIMLGAASLAAIELKIDALAAIGFHYVAEFNAVMPMRRYFVLPASRPREAHLHAVVRGGKFWCDHLLFRDALRRDAALATAYRALKLDLASKFANDSAAYADAKTDFVQNALNHARMTAKE